ncbi:hypothetical protein A6A40_03950 [Azospirillum humicireducens]|uniref:Uncharacterized protein n=1 Tax=Azospirillum humicireducens TaxID=1226968 RepID=A0A160JEA5_9PROT|nr:hypothetical protein [Azospirillum humicireducens]ANC91122.1 hypothetical protein A6A40_03950 [Azospirillum humicireducens]
MIKRSRNSGVRLTASDAAIVKGMRQRGDRQHDIASFFGVNAGRIAEICTGKRFASVMPAESESLPPQGPYLTLAQRWRSETPARMTGRW